MDNSRVGLIHIYCGDGKGKTTAAVGAAVRAAGAGLKVCFMQLMKSGTSSELSVIKNIEDITLYTVENPYGFTWKMTADEKAKLTELNNNALQAVLELNEHSRYDVIVIDEIMSAYQNGLVDKTLVLTLIKQCKGNTELILTGRYPAPELLDQADYITEMKCQRHPYENGIGARMGIEF